MSTPSRVNDEHRRIADVYSARSVDGSDALWGCDRPDVSQNVKALQAALLTLTHRAVCGRQWQGRVLDVGCGGGAGLAILSALGAAPGHWVGVDLLSERVRSARSSLPLQAGIVRGSALELPFEDSSFDALYVGTVFSSILDSQFQHSLAGELRRVVRPNGIIAIYDFRYPSLRNSNVRRVTRRNVRSWFPELKCWRMTLTLLPPIARSLAPLFPRMSRVCEAALPPLRSHALYFLRGG